MKITGILLAAGRSRRMGAFKPLLPFGDQSVIQRCIANLRAGGVDHLILVLGHRAEDIKDHLSDPEIHYVLNPDPDSEMAASIACGVEAAPEETGALVIAPGDHPAVDGEVTRLLIEKWRNGATLVKPEYKGRGGHPVVIDSSFRAELLRLPAGGLRSFFNAHQNLLTRVAVESAFIARDLDTWDDYLALHQEVLGKLPSIEQHGSYDTES